MSCERLTRCVTYGIRLDGQRYLQPLDYVHSLAAWVQQRGGQVEAGAAVTSVSPAAGGGILVECAAASGPAGVRSRFDAVVLASGAWLARLGRPAGVRMALAAGRGYSFAVQADQQAHFPLYLPAARVACTPTADGALLRLGGTMEFRRPDAPLDDRRIRAIERSVRGFFSGVDWSTLAGF
jgi:D-amino-acid dehydrogenase